MISTYNALLTTAYFLGTIIGSIMWGWIADRIGRKTALIITLCCRFSHLLSLLVNVVVLYLFGMCSHIKPAIPKSDRIESHAKELSQLETSLLPSSAPKLPSVWSALAEKDTCLLVISYSTSVGSISTSFHQPCFHFFCHRLYRRHHQFPCHGRLRTG